MVAMATAKRGADTPPSSEVVEIRNLSKTYRMMLGKQIRALDDVSFSIRRGETFAIVGPNGSGKTTAMKILLGLLFPDDGSLVSIFGHQPGDTRVQARLGYLPEAPYFYEFLTGRELLDYYGKLCNVPDDVRKKRIEELLATVDLQERGADMPIRFYSRGMRQRVGIAQAMINSPELLVLDEPTNGLDPLGTVQVRQFILEQKRQKRTILLCSHLLSEVEAVADRVAILHRGKLLACDKVSRLVPESEQWQLTATDMNREAVANLRAAGFDVDTHGDVLTLKTGSLDTVYKALGMVRDNGGQLVEITRPQPTLEQQFLKAVGEEKLRETVDALQRDMKG